MLSDSLREDLSHQHMEELNKLNKQHAAQLQASRLELQRAMELRKREVVNGILFSA